MKLALGWLWSCPRRGRPSRISFSAQVLRAAPRRTVYQTSSPSSSTSRSGLSNKEVLCCGCIRPGVRAQGGLLPRLILVLHSVPLTRVGLSPSMSQRRSSSTRSPKSDDDRDISNSAQSTSYDPGDKHSDDHSHDDHDHAHTAEQMAHIFEGKGDRGSRITLLGLLINVGLTSAKGVAGWYMHSASLLADAGHSLSDLLGDFVTLFYWKLSRKPPSEGYPYGFAKFETLGTTTISLLLIGGALGIGFHSYHLLTEALLGTVSTLPPGQLHDILQHVTSLVHRVPSVGHTHTHVNILDPNAAWFAALSVLVKEWLYRVTKKVADEEHSSVLYANAVHHRSDAYSSFVALFAILGSSIYPTLPFDPLGGLLVSLVILQQGITLLKGAFAELTDAGISTSLRDKLLHALDPLLQRGVTNVGTITISEGFRVKELKARRAGSLLNVDLIVHVSPTMTVLTTFELEEEIIRKLKHARREVSEVRVRFHPVEDSPS